MDANRSHIKTRVRLRRHVKFLFSMAALGMLVAVPASAQHTETISNIFSERSIERFTIVCIGGMSLWCGYRLFRITSQCSSELVAKGAGYSISLSQIGPGIFFAFFGAAILTYALYVRPTVTADAAPDGSMKHIGISGALPVYPGQKISKEDTFLQLNTLFYLINSCTKVSDEKRRAAVEQLFTKLEPLRRDLVDSILSEGRYNEWYRLQSLQKNNPKALTEELQSNADLRRRYYQTDNLIKEKTDVD